NEIGPGAEAKHERPNGESGKHGKFQPGNPAQKACANSRTGDVRQADRPDGDDGGDFYDQRRPVKNVGRIRCESHGECRSESGIKDQKAHPSIEEGSERAESFTQVHVRAARTRETSSEFAEAERAAKGHRADGEPDDE